jgi:hypothetical protein
MDWWFSKKAQLQMMISMERDVVEFSRKWMCVLHNRNLCFRVIGTFVVLNQPPEISSLDSIISQGRDTI